MADCNFTLLTTVCGIEYGHFPLPVMYVCMYHTDSEVTVLKPFTPKRFSHSTAMSRCNGTFMHVEWPLLDTIICDVTGLLDDLF